MQGTRTLEVLSGESHYEQSEDPSEAAVCGNCHRWSGELRVIGIADNAGIGSSDAGTAVKGTGGSLELTGRPEEPVRRGPERTWITVRTIALIRRRQSAFKRPPDSEAARGGHCRETGRPGNGPNLWQDGPEIFWQIPKMLTANNLQRL